MSTVADSIFGSSSSPSARGTSSPFRSGRRPTSAWENSNRDLFSGEPLPVRASPTQKISKTTAAALEKNPLLGLEFAAKGLIPKEVLDDYNANENRARIAEIGKKEALVPDANGELYRRDGSRPLAVGDIIEVHSGPILFRKRPVAEQKEKKGRGGGSKKRGAKTTGTPQPRPQTLTFGPEDDEEGIVPDEDIIFEENDDAGERDDADGDDAYAEAQEEGAGLAIEEKYASGDGDDAPAKGDDSDAPKGKGMILPIDYEVQHYVDFLTVDNPIYSSSKTLANLAETLGIPTKKITLGAASEKSAIYDTGYFYQETRLMQVGPGGTLIPLKGRTFKIGETDPRAIPSIPIDPALLRPIRKNPYSDVYAIGERVRFSNPRFTTGRGGKKSSTDRYAYGTITGASEKELTVVGRVLEDSAEYSRQGGAEGRRGSPKRHDAPRKVSYVPYSDPNLRLAPRYGSLIEVNDIQKTRGIVVGVGPEGVVYFPVNRDSRRTADLEANERNDADARVRRPARGVDYEKARYDQIRIVPRGPPRPGTENDPYRGRDPMRLTMLQIPVAEPMEKLYGRPVTKELRKIVREIYVQCLKDMTASKDATVSASTTVERAVLESEPIPFKKYVDVNRLKWLSDRHRAKILGAIDVTALREKIQTEATKNEKFEVYLDYLVDLLNNYQRTSFEDGVEVKSVMGFTPSTSAQDVLGVFRSKTSSGKVDLFDAFVVTYLDKKVGPGFKPIQGHELALLIRDLLTEFLRRYPPNIDSLVSAAIEAEVLARIKKIVKTDLSGRSTAADPSEEKKFQTRVVPGLKTVHDEAMKKWRASAEAYARDAERKERDNVVRQNLSNRARVIEDQVIIFEAGIYEKYGEVETSKVSTAVKGKKTDEAKRAETTVAAAEKSIYVYLVHALVPYIFMKGLLAPHAKLFRAKIANGSYDFGLMGSANLAHFLPEFVMSARFGTDERTEELWEAAGDVIQTLLVRVVDEVLDVYYSVLYPSQRRENRGQFMFSAFEADRLTENLVDVHEVCQADTKTGYRPMLDRAGRVIKGSELQKIPDGDLVICFDDITKKFSCHDSREVMVQIRNGNRKNPITGTEFSKDFVSRISARYEEELETGTLVPVPVAEKENRIPRGATPSKILSSRLPSYVSIFGVDAQQLLLFGDSIEVDGNEVSLSETHTSESEVSVVTFDYTDRKTLANVINLKPAKGEKVYAIGVNAASVTPQVRERVRAEIVGKRKSVNVKFNAPTSSTEDIETSVAAAIRDFASSR